MHWYAQEEETHVAQYAAGGLQSQCFSIESAIKGWNVEKSCCSGTLEVRQHLPETARATQLSGPQRFRPHLLKSGQNGAAFSRHASASWRAVFFFFFLFYECSRMQFGFFIYTNGLFRPQGKKGYHHKEYLHNILKRHDFFFFLKFMPFVFDLDICLLRPFFFAIGVVAW